MRNSENIYDSLFGCLLFIWLFFTLLSPPLTFSQSGIFSVCIFICSPKEAWLALPRAGLCSSRSLMSPVLGASLSVLSSLCFRPLISSVPLPTSNLSLLVSRLQFQPHPGQETWASGPPPPLMVVFKIISSLQQGQPSEQKSNLFIFTGFLKSQLNLTLQYPGSRNGAPDLNHQGLMLFMVFIHRLTFCFSPCLLCEERIWFFVFFFQTVFLGTGKCLIKLLTGTMNKTLHTHENFH